MTDRQPDFLPSVSIVIPTRNVADHLECCLASIREHAPGVEVIVVDQQSTDGTREVAAHAGAVVIDAAPPNIYTLGTRSRNVGAALARGTYLVHLDADMSLVRPWLDEAVALCEHGHVAVVLEEDDLASGFWANCKALERRSYHNSPVEAARFVRASLFSEVGGYDETLGSGEDFDIHGRYAAHGSIGRISQALHHRVGRMSFRRQLRRKFNYGRSVPAFLKTHNTQPLARPMLTAYARSWRTFAADPAHALGFIALRFSEAAAMSAGVAYERIPRRRLRLDPR